MTGSNNSFKIILIIIISAFVVGTGFFFYFNSAKNGYETYAVFPNGQKIKIIDVRVTNKEREEGLSGRKTLQANEGMYFSFPEEAVYGFWMKDMNFPIDILWISKGVLVGASENALPEPGIPDSELKVYSPPQPIGAVLEMTAGAKQRYNLQVGDEVQIRIIPKK